MITAYLYRYPHPYTIDRFIYVGQERTLGSRDRKHRFGTTSFGRKFKIKFPGMSLPEPVHEKIEVQDILSLNENETINMFKYHTWCGYEDGMNMTFPRSRDYKNIAILGGLAGKGSIKIKKYFDSTKQSIAGKKTFQNKIGIFARTKEQCIIDSRKGGIQNILSGHLYRLQKLWVGRSHTPETKLKMRAAAVGRNLGRKMSLVARMNMSASRLGKKRGPYKKKILADLKSGSQEN